MKRHMALLSLLFLVGCASLNRDCSSCTASNFGANWIVVQYKNDGTPINCWKLKNTAIDNETNSDGIYWKDPHSSNLVHISGWYNRVQVVDGDWGSAAKSLNVKEDICNDGAYVQ